MKESYGEGPASHTDPESCDVVREGHGEALTGALAGSVLSREILKVWGADAVGTCGRQHAQARQGESLSDPTRSETRACKETHHAGAGRSRLRPGEMVTRSAT